MKDTSINSRLRGASFVSVLASLRLISKTSDEITHLEASHLHLLLSKGHNWNGELTLTVQIRRDLFLVIYLLTTTFFSEKFLLSRDYSINYLSSISIFGAVSSRGAFDPDAFEAVSRRQFNNISTLDESRRLVRAAGTRNAVGPTAGVLERGTIIHYDHNLRAHRLNARFRLRFPVD
ncbi:hypothetical protein V1272_001113 [Bradyrhizobium sp. AZCC 1708]